MANFEVEIKVAKTWLLTYDVKADSADQAKQIIGGLYENGDLCCHVSHMYADSGSLPSDVTVSECMPSPNDVFVDDECVDFKSVTEIKEEEEV